MSYGKLFASAFTGSMFGQRSVVHAVLSYAIANMRPSKSDGECYVELNPTMLGPMFSETTADVVKAIEYLCSPDEASRSKKDAGRRLRPESAVSVGPAQYKVVNGAHYRSLRDDDDRREYMREAKRKERKRKRKPSSAADNHGQPASTTVNQSPPPTTQAEAEAEAEAKRESVLATPPEPPVAQSRFVPPKKPTRWDLNHTEALFSECRKAAKHGAFRRRPSDYDRLQSLTDLAVSEAESRGVGPEQVLRWIFAAWFDAAEDFAVKARFSFASLTDPGAWLAEHDRRSTPEVNAGGKGYRARLREELDRAPNDQERERIRAEIIRSQRADGVGVSP